MRKLVIAFAIIASPVFAQDGPGPNLVIEVSGEANGRVVIDLMEDVAPKHVAQIAALAEEGAYNGVAFHRVIDGFMAQTGDVECGRADASCPAGVGASESGSGPLVGTLVEGTTSTGADAAVRMALPRVTSSRRARSSSRSAVADG